MIWLLTGTLGCQSDTREHNIGIAYEIENGGDPMVE